MWNSAKLRLSWETLRESFWFIPTLMAVIAIFMALGGVMIDRKLEADSLRGIWWIYTGGSEGARAVLSTIAGSIITVAGVTFSITIAVLSLTSQQFGPRLLNNFMRDRGNQGVLGTFIGTFLYCLLVLRTVRGLEEYLFVPHIAVTVGVLLGTASLGVLIYFIHHVAESIQVSTVIDRVGRELDGTIDRLFPSKLGQGAGEVENGARRTSLPEDFDRTACPVPSGEFGYVLALDGDRLMRVASEKDLTIRLTCHPGQYIVGGQALAHAWPSCRIDEAAAHEIEAVFSLGKQRTTFQDALFGVDQLVEIAVRALSPGVNDPFTAMMCVDRLGASLCRLAEREIPSPCRYEDSGKLRMVVPTVNFVELADAAFHPIRQYGKGSEGVLIRLLESLTALAARVRREEDRAALLHHASLVVQTTQNGDWESRVLQAVQEKQREMMDTLSREGDGGSESDG